MSCSYKTVRHAISSAPAILKSAQILKADLISLASYRQPDAPAILGGTVRDVLSAANVPVLVVHSLKK